MISQATIDRIFQAVHIMDVVGDFVTLKKRGVNYLGLCPFHNEKSPSFTVSPNKEIYKCFGCGKAGNSVGFIMDHEKLSYPEALRYLAEKYKIPIEETGSPQDKEAFSERESLLSILTAAQNFYAEQLWEKEEGKNIAQPYLKERKLNTDVAKKFGLGWAPSGWEALAGYAGRIGLQTDLLHKLGLINEGRNGGWIDRFRERLMFPIHNVTGKVVGFGGRILRSNTKEAKYINSPESDIYNKSKLLYGLFQAKNGIRNEDECILVEGYMDVVSLHQAGIENVVASSGTSLTEDQVRLMKRYTDNILFLFDGDSAGQKAALRALDMALGADMNPRFVTLPAEHDPDTFSKAYSVEEIRAYFKEKKQNFLEFKCAALLSGTNGDPIKKAEAVREIMTSLALVTDPVKRSLFLKEAVRLLGMEEGVLHDELKRIALTKFKKENRSATEEETMFPPGDDDFPPPPDDAYISGPSRTESSHAQERRIIRNLVMYGEQLLPESGRVGQYVIEKIGDLAWDDELCRRIFDDMKTALGEQGEAVDFSYFVNHPDPTVQNLVSNLVIEAHTLDEGWERKLERKVLRPADSVQEEIVSAASYFVLRKILAIIRKNQEDLKTNLPNEEIEMLLYVHGQLNQRKVELMKELGIVLI